jgi:hypothetical protein
MQITGNATVASGGPIDAVRVFEWPTGALAAIATPDEGGDWTATIETTGDYGVTYIAEGHQPITHGPYYIEAGGAALPEVIGEAAGGGFYAGDIEDGGQWYKLIVADVEADVYGLIWGGNGTNLPAATSTTNGLANTEAMRGNSEFEAGNHCLDWRGGGFDDWYMPARSELQVIFENLGHDKTPPSGFESGGSQALHESHYKRGSAAMTEKTAATRTARTIVCAPFAD